MPAQSMEQLVSLCKRRGFIFQTNEIYGGLQGVYDYGPLGVELKENLKRSWWAAMVYSRDDVEGLDASILTNKKVLKYSGHEDTFTDPLVDCKDCNNRMRADHLKDSKCLHCGSTNLTEPPVSDPIPHTARLNATEAAAPDEEPPATALRLFMLGGLCVIGFKPSPENASSDICVFPKHISPASVAFLNTVASVFGILPFNNSVPASVKISVVSKRSFQEIGTPSK